MKNLRRFAQYIGLIHSDDGTWRVLGKEVETGFRSRRPAAPPTAPTAPPAAPTDEH